MIIFFLILLSFFGINTYSQEPQACFPRVTRASHLSGNNWFIHLYEDQNLSGKPVIKFEEKFYLLEGGNYVSYDLVGNRALTPKIQSEVPFLKFWYASGALMFFCPTEKNDVFYVEYFDKKLYFKQKNFHGNISYEDPDKIRNLLQNNLSYQKILKDFNDCLDRQGEGCARKEDERSAKLMLFMVDSFIETDCKKEMPEMTSFDEKKKYQFRKGVIDKAKSIMNTNNEYSVLYSLSLKSSEKFEYSIEMYSSEAYLCKNRSFEGIGIRFVIDKEKKGYFEFEYPSTSPNLTDSKGPYYYDED